FGIFFDVVGWDNAANQSFGALGRATSIGLGTTDGYGLTYSTAGSLDLVRIAVDGQVGNLKVVHDVSKGGADGKIQAVLQRRVVVGAGIDDLEGGDVDAGPQNFHPLLGLPGGVSAVECDIRIASCFKGARPQMNRCVLAKRV